jgi:hypothetical protein
MCAGIWIGSGIVLRLRLWFAPPPSPETRLVYHELKPWYWPAVVVGTLADAADAGLHLLDWLWLAVMFGAWWWLRNADDDDRWRRRARAAAAWVARAGARLRVVPQPGTA